MSVVGLVDYVIAGNGNWVKAHYGGFFDAVKLIIITNKTYMKRKRTDGVFSPIKKELDKQFNLVKKSQVDPIDMYKSIWKGVTTGFRFLKGRPRLLVGIAVFVTVLLVGGIVSSSVSNSNRARLNEERRLADIESRKDECNKKGRSSSLRYATKSYSGRNEEMDLKAGGYFLTDSKPNVFIDGQDVELESNKINVQRDKGCEELGIVLYEASFSVKSDDCKEESAKLVVDNVEKELNVKNDGSCRTKTEIEAEKLARAQEEARKLQEKNEQEKRKKELENAENAKKKVEAERKSAEAEKKRIDDLLFEAEITCQQYAEVWFRVSDINISYNHSSIRRQQPDGNLLIKANVADSKGTWKPDVPLGVMECTTSPDGLRVVDFINY